MPGACGPGSDSATRPGRSAAWPVAGCGVLAPSTGSVGRFGPGPRDSSVIRSSPSSQAWPTAVGSDRPSTDPAGRFAGLRPSGMPIPTTLAGSTGGSPGDAARGGIWRSCVGMTAMACSTFLRPGASPSPPESAAFTVGILDRGGAGRRDVFSRCADLGRASCGKPSLRSSVIKSGNIATSSVFVRSRLFLSGPGFPNGRARPRYASHRCHPMPGLEGDVVRRRCTDSQACGSGFLTCLLLIVVLHEGALLEHDIRHLSEILPVLILSCAYGKYVIPLGKYI